MEWVVWLAELASIGSVVRIHESKFVVIGHRMARDELNIGMCYILVPYPLGFVDASSLSLTPIGRVDTVLAQGYCPDAGMEYLDELSKLVEESEGIRYDDYADAVLSFKNYLKEERVQDE